MAEVKKPNIKKQPAPWEPGQQHPKKKPWELDGFSDRVRRQQEQEKPRKKAFLEVEKMSTLLPELTDYAGYKKAQAQEKKTLQAVETTQAQVQELQQQAQEADAAGASFKDLQAAQDKAAEAGRAAELAARELDQAAAQAQEQLLEAEAHIKEAAKEAGKKIVNKITRALTALETGQKEHKALLAELRAKVGFPRPLSGENAERYTGPDPTPVFAIKSWPLIGYKESCERYLKDWPEPKKPKSREYEPKGQIMLG